MTEQHNDPAAYLERAARILGVPLNSERLSAAIANPKNFHALFQTISASNDASGGSRKPTPLDAFRR
jgi:hypothetical protein